MEAFTFALMGLVDFLWGKYTEAHSSIDEEQLSQVLVESTLTYIFFNKNSIIFSCTPDCPATMMQEFYCRNELLARNSTDKLSAPSGASQQHTRAPDMLSDELLS